MIQSALDLTSKITIEKEDEWSSTALRQKLFKDNVIPALPHIHDIPPIRLPEKQELLPLQSKGIVSPLSKQEKQVFVKGISSLTLDPIMEAVDFFTKPPSPRHDEALIEQGIQKAKDHLIAPIAQALQSEVQKATQAKKEFEDCGRFTAQCLAQADLVRVIEGYGLEGGKALIKMAEDMKEGIRNLEHTRQQVAEMGLVPSIPDPFTFLSSTIEITHKAVEILPTIVRRTHRLITGNVEAAQDFGDITALGLTLVGPKKLTTGTDVVKLTQGLDKATKRKSALAALDLPKNSQSPANVIDALGLEAPKMVKHHVFNKFRGQSAQSQKYRDFFKKHGIDVDSYTIEIPETFHKNKIHVAHNNWTTKWKQWIDANPYASTKEVYQFGGKLMDEYSVNSLPLVKYNK